MEATKQATEYKFDWLTDELFTTKQVADMLGCSIPKVRELYGGGKIVAFKIGRRLVRIPRSEAIRFLKAKKSPVAN